MPEVDLDAVENALAATTGERWSLTNDPDGNPAVEVRLDNGQSLILRLTRERIPASANDVMFIAHARQDTEILIAAVRGRQPLTKHELDGIIERCSAASPGPWRAFLEGDGGHGGSDVISVSDLNTEPDLYLWFGQSPASPADFGFVARARQEIPDLVAMLRVDGDD